MEEPVAEEQRDFLAHKRPVAAAIIFYRLQGNDNISEHCRTPRRRWKPLFKRKHIRRLLLVSIVPIQLRHTGIVAKQDANFRPLGEAFAYADSQREAAQCVPPIEPFSRGFVSYA
jgi:hypothetical protein